jgi:HNH endonuclease
MSHFYEFRHRTFWVKKDGRIWNENDELMQGKLEGYPSINMRFKEDGKLEYVTLFHHRIVAEIFVPNPEDKPFVIHLDADKANNNAENLAWATFEERYLHQSKMGLFNKPKLTVQEVSEIKERIKHRIPFSIIAEEYGVSHTQINRINRGENWAYV